MPNKSILITGAAGFIGFHLCKNLLQNGQNIIGFDNLNNYYDINLKKRRLKELEKLNIAQGSWNFHKDDLTNRDALNFIFAKYQPKIIVHLAAQAGVRFSFINPSSYIESNIIGFHNILELSKEFKIENLIFASSSSVYGGNKNIPFSENESVDHPVSLYAATKKSNELMAHVYSHSFNIPCSGIRFFTVYGPWGRPDMAPMIFANSIINKKPIKIFNNGEMSRDFTYIDDVIECLKRLIMKPAISSASFDRFAPDSSSSWAPYKIFNIGNSSPIKLLDFVAAIETELGTKATKIFEPMQQGDIEDTAADTNLISDWINYRPNTTLNKGIKEFINWYKNYYIN
tara:strand:- start:864 stop:1892 length:1029 start_codon:yes stop_codon:yes gene_type:complete